MATVKSSGSLSFSEIQAVHGGARPLKMSDYRRGQRTRDLKANEGVPIEASGIKFSQFYSTTSYESGSIAVAGYETLHFASYPGSWTDKTSTRNTITVNYAETKFSVPKISMKIRGDETEHDYSSNDHNGVRNPGVRIVHKSSGTVVLSTRGAGESTDDDSGYLAVDIPAKTATTTLTGDFEIQFILGGYNGGSSWNAWASPAFTVTWETAEGITSVADDIIRLTGAYSQYAVVPLKNVIFAVTDYRPQTIGWTFNSNGQITSAGMDGAVAQFNEGSEWCNSTPDKTYYIRASVANNGTQGAYPATPNNSGSSALDTWLDLDSDRKFLWDVPTLSNKYGAIKVEISDSPTGATILATGLYAISATAVNFGGLYA